MIDKHEHDTDDSGFIVQINQGPVIQSESNQLFENLKRITPEEIDKA